MSTLPTEVPRSTIAAAQLDRLAGMVERVEAGWMVSGHGAADAAALSDALYAHWYTQPAERASPALDDPPISYPSLIGPLRAAAAAAFAPSGPWTVTANDPRGSLAATRGETARFLRPGDYLMPQRPGVLPAPGEPVTVVVPLEHVDGETGIWWLFGDPPPQRPFGRIYFNARPATAPRVVHEIAAALATQSFQLKCPAQATACDRVDAIVLYHPLGSRAEALAALEARLAQLAPLLDPATPPLTNAWRPGIAWADDVDASHSFGEQRCGLLAAGIAQADDVWADLDRGGRVAVLTAALQAAGVNPARPWETVQ